MSLVDDPLFFNHSFDFTCSNWTVSLSSPSLEGVAETSIVKLGEIISITVLELSVPTLSCTSSIIKIIFLPSAFVFSINLSMNISPSLSSRILFLELFILGQLQKKFHLMKFFLLIKFSQNEHFIVFESLKYFSSFSLL